MQRVLESVLLRIFGAYVDGINQENLSLSIRKGQVELKDLRLKPNAFDSFNLPFTVKAGFLKSLTVNFKLTQFASSPVRLLVEDVFVLAVPQSSFGSGVDAANAAAIRHQEQERLRSQKMYLLRQAEVLKSLADATNIPAEGEKGFVHKLTEKILSNLQLTVKRIHVRFEDTLTFPAKPFSFGFRLDELRTFSVNENGEEGFFVPTADAHGAILTRKRVFLRNAALYWDSKPQLWQDLPFPAMINAFAQTFAGPAAHSYLLLPSSADGTIVINHNEADFTAPRISVAVGLDHLQLEVASSQYHDLMAFIRAVSTHRRKEQIVAAVCFDRPALFKNAKADIHSWWKYAANAVMRLKRFGKHQPFRFEWQRTKRYLSLRRSYVSLFARAITDAATVSNDEVRWLEKAEDDLDIQAILSFRALAEAEAKILSSKRASADAKKPKSRWSWFSHDDADSKSSTGPEEFSLTEDERRALWRSIDYDGVVNLLTPPANYFQFKFMFHCRALELLLRDEVGPIARVATGGALNFRQREAGWTLELAMTSLLLTDCCTPKSTQTRILHVPVPVPVQGIPKSTFDKADLLRDCMLWLLVDHTAAKAARSTAALEWEVGLKFASVHALYAPYFLGRTSAFFSADAQEALRPSTRGVDQMVAQTQVELIRQASRLNPRSIRLDMDVASPVLVVPEALERANCSIFVLQMGHLKLQTAAAHGTGVPVIAADVGHYESYQLMVEAVSVHLSTLTEYHSVLNGTGQLQSMPHVISPFTIGTTISVFLAQRHSKHVGPLPPKLVLVSSAPSIDIRLSSSCYRLLSSTSFALVAVTPERHGVHPVSPLSASKAPALALFGELAAHRSDDRKTEQRVPLPSLEWDDSSLLHTFVAPSVDIRAARTTLVWDLTLERCRCTLLNDTRAGSSRAAPYLIGVVDFEGFSQHFAANVHYSSYTLQVGSLEVRDLTPHNGGVACELELVSQIPATRSVLATSKLPSLSSPAVRASANEFISFQMTSISPQARKHRDLGTVVWINFGGLLVQWNPLTMADVDEFLTVPVMSRPLPAVSTPAPVVKAAVSPSTKVVASDSSPANGLAIAARIGHITALFQKDYLTAAGPVVQDFLIASLRDVRVVMTIESDPFALDLMVQVGTLGASSLIAGSELDDYRSFIRMLPFKSGAADHALRFGWKQWDPDHPLHPGRDIGIDVAVTQQFRLVYLHNLWVEVIDYFTEGMVGIIISIFTTKSQKTLVDIFRGYPYFKLQLPNPLVVAPVARNSPQRMELDLGSLVVSNELLYHKAGVFPSAQEREFVMQRFWIKSTAATFYAVLPSDPSAARRRILPGTDVALSISAFSFPETELASNSVAAAGHVTSSREDDDIVAVLPVSGQAAVPNAGYGLLADGDMEVALHVSTADFALTYADIVLVMDIVDTNFTAPNESAAVTAAPALSTGGLLIPPASPELSKSSSKIRYKFNDRSKPPSRLCLKFELDHVTANLIAVSGAVIGRVLMESFVLDQVIGIHQDFYLRSRVASLKLLPGFSAAIGSSAVNALDAVQTLADIAAFEVNYLVLKPASRFYARTDGVLTVDFTTLSFRWLPEEVASLYLFCVQDKASTMPSTQSTPALPRSDSVFAKRYVSPDVLSVINLDLRVSASRVSAQFDKDEAHQSHSRPFLDCRFLEPRVNLTVSPLSHALSVQLDQVDVEHVGDSESLHRTVLRLGGAIAGDSAAVRTRPSQVLEVGMQVWDRHHPSYQGHERSFLVHMVQRPERAVTSTTALPSPAGVSSAAVGGIRFVFLQKLFLEIVDYFTEGVIGILVSKTARSLEEVLASQPRLTVDIPHPLISVPRGARAPESVELDLGRIRITNAVSAVQAVAPLSLQPTEPHASLVRLLLTFNIESTGLQLYDVDYHSKARLPVLNDVEYVRFSIGVVTSPSELALTHRSAMEQPSLASHLPSVDADITLRLSLPKVTGCISRKQMAVLWAIVDDNLAAPSSKAPVAIGPAESKSQNASSPSSADVIVIPAPSPTSASAKLVKYQFGSNEPSKPNSLRMETQLESLAVTLMPTSAAEPVVGVVSFEGFTSVLYSGIDADTTVTFNLRSARLQESDSGPAGAAAAVVGGNALIPGFKPTQPLPPLSSFTLGQAERLHVVLTILGSTSTKYANEDRLVDVSLDSIDIGWHPVAMQRLYRYSLQPAELTPLVVDDGISLDAARASLSPERTLWRLRGALHQLRLVFFGVPEKAQPASLFEFAVRNGFVEHVMQESRMTTTVLLQQMEGSLGSDRSVSPAPVIKRFLDVRSGLPVPRTAADRSAVRFHMVEHSSKAPIVSAAALRRSIQLSIFDRSFDASAESAAGSSSAAGAACEFVYVQQLWTDLVHYFSQGVIGVLISKTAESLEETLAEHPLVSVDIGHPIFVVPVSAWSDRTVHVDLGRITVDTVTNAAPAAAVTAGRAAYRIASSKLRLYQLLPKSVQRQEIMDPVEFSMDVSHTPARPAVGGAQPQPAVTPAVACTAKLSNVRARVSPGQLVSILDIVDYNLLSERPVTFLSAASAARSRDDMKNVEQLDGADSGPVKSPSASAPTSVEIAVQLHHLDLWLVGGSGDGNTLAGQDVAGVRINNLNALITSHEGVEQTVELSMQSLSLSDPAISDGSVSDGVLQTLRNSQMGTVGPMNVLMIGDIAALDSFKLSMRTVPVSSRLYQNTRRKAQLGLGTLNARWNPESMTILYCFLQDTVTLRSKHSLGSDAQAADMTSPAQSETRRRSVTALASPSELKGIDTDFQMSLDRISVVFEKTYIPASVADDSSSDAGSTVEAPQRVWSYDLVVLNAQQMRVVVIDTAASSVKSITLDSLELLDVSSAHSLNRTILSLAKPAGVDVYPALKLESRTVFTSAIELGHPQVRREIDILVNQTPSAGGPADAVPSVTAGSSSFRIVYLHQLWLEIIDYVTQGVFGVLMTRTGDSIDETLATFPKLTVSVQHPLIVVPRSRSSVEQLHLDLGSITVTNQLVAVMAKDGASKTGHEFAVDWRAVTLSQNLALENRKIAMSNEVDVPLRVVNITGGASRSDVAASTLGAASADSILSPALLTLESDVDAVISAVVRDIRVTITRAQYLLLLDILNENVNASAVAHPSLSPLPSTIEQSYTLSTAHARKASLDATWQCGHCGMLNSSANACQVCRSSHSVDSTLTSAVVASQSLARRSASPPPSASVSPAPSPSLAVRAGLTSPVPAFTPVKRTGSLDVINLAALRTPVPAQRPSLRAGRLRTVTFKYQSTEAKPASFQVRFVLDEVEVQLLRARMHSDGTVTPSETPLSTSKAAGAPAAQTKAALRAPGAANVDMTSATVVPFAVFRLVKASGTVLRRLDGSISLELSMQSIRLVDLAPASDPAFRNVIAPASELLTSSSSTAPPAVGAAPSVALVPAGSTDEPVMTLRWVQYAPTGSGARLAAPQMGDHHVTVVRRESIYLLLANACGYVLPEFLSNMVEFLTPESRVSGAGNAEPGSPDSPKAGWAPSDDSAMPVPAVAASVIAGADRPNPVVQTELTLVLHNARLVFVEDVLNAASRGLVASSDVTLKRNVLVPVRRHGHHGTHTAVANAPKAVVPAAGAAGQPQSNPFIDASKGRMVTIATTDLVLAQLQIYVCAAAHPAQSSVNVVLRPCGLELQLGIAHWLSKADTPKGRAPQVKPTDSQSDAHKQRDTHQHARVRCEDVQNVRGKLNAVEVRVSFQTLKMAMNILNGFIRHQEAMTERQVREREDELVASALVRTSLSPAGAGQPQSSAHAAVPPPTTLAQAAWMPAPETIIGDVAVVPQPLIAPSERDRQRKAAAALKVKKPKRLGPFVSAVEWIVSSAGYFEFVGLHAVLIDDSLGQLMPLASAYINRSTAQIRQSCSSMVHVDKPLVTKALDTPEAFSLLSFALSSAPPVSASNNTVVNSELNMQANFFSPKRGHWELLMEPASLGVHIAMEDSVPAITPSPAAAAMASVTRGRAEDASKPQSSVLVNVQANSNVGVNVSYDLVSSLVRFRAAWASPSVQNTSRSKELLSFSPFYIRNELGAPITYWFGPQPSSLAERECVVQSGQEAPIDVQKYVPDFMSLQLSADANLRINFALAGGFDANRDISISKVESSNLLLSHSARAFPITPIEVDVSLRGGSKVVSLLPPLKILNMSRIDLEFRARDGKGPLIGPVAYQQRVYVPTWRGGDWSQMLCRPAGMGDMAAWSSASVFVGSRLGDPTLLQCAVGDRPVFLLARVRPTVAQCYEVEIYPPITLRNLFPFRCTYQVRTTADNALLAKGSLDSGSDAHLHEVGSGRSYRHPGPAPALDRKGNALPLFQISFQVEGYSSTQMVPFTHFGPSVESHVPVTPDDQPSARAVNLYVDNKEGVAGDAQRILNLYARVWLVNRTAIPLIYGVVDSSEDRRVRASGKPRPPGMTLFDEQVDTGGRIYVAAQGFQFNRQGINLTAATAGLDGVIQLRSSMDSGAHVTARPPGARDPFVELAVWFDRPQGDFSGTRIVTLLPRYVILNTLNRPLVLQQTGAPADAPTNTWLMPGVESAFTWHSVAGSRTVCLSFEGSYQSSSFSIEDVGDVAVKILARSPAARPSTSSSAAALAEIVTVRVKVEVVRTQYVVTLSREEYHFPAYRIENHTPYDVSFCQDLRQEDGSPPVNPVPWPEVRLPPMHMVPYAWEDLQAAKPLALLLTIGRQQELVELDNSQFDEVWAVQVGTDHQPLEEMIKAHTVSDGPTQVLIIQMADAVVQDDVDAYGSDATLELGPARTITTRLSAPGRIVMSFYDQRDKNITNVLLDDLFISRIRDAQRDEAMEMHVRTFQLDNREPEAKHPIAFRSEESNSGKCLVIQTRRSFAKQEKLLRSMRLRTRLKSQMLRSLQGRSAYHNLSASIASRDVSSVIINQYDLVSIVLAKCSVKLDDRFLGHLQWFVQGLKDEQASWKRESVNNLAALELKQSSSDPALAMALNAQLSPMSRAASLMSSVDSADEVKTMVFIERIEVAPIALSFSFSVSPASSKQNDYHLLSLRNPLTQLASIKDAPITVDSVVLIGVFCTQTELMDRMVMHYRTYLVPTALTLLGSAETLGNPIGLITSLASGVSGFGRHTIAGRPLTGAASLVKNTVAGVTDTVAGFTKGVSSAVAELSFDKEYIEKRAAVLDAEDRKNVTLLKGMQYGGQHLAKGIWKGVSDVFVQPVKGAQDTGIGGFFSGLGKAVVGLAVKPVVGVVDATTTVVKSVRRSVNDDDKKKVETVREISRHATPLPAIHRTGSPKMRSAIVPPSPPRLPATPHSSGVKVPLNSNPNVPMLGPAVVDVLHLVRVGLWIFGAYDETRFIIQYGEMCTVLIDASGVVSYRERRSAASPDYAAEVPDERSIEFEPAVLRLGNWALGPAPASEYFALNSLTSRNPELVLRKDGIVFCRDLKPLPNKRTACHAGPSEHVVQLGNWLFGPLPSNPNIFVINVVGSVRPQFCLDTEASIYATRFRKVNSLLDLPMVPMNALAGATTVGRLLKAHKQRLLNKGASASASGTSSSGGSGGSGPAGVAVKRSPSPD